MKKKILIGGICFCLFLTGCSSTKDIAKTVKKATNNIKNDSILATDATPAPKQTKLALKKKGTVGSWQIVVKKAEKRATIKKGTFRLFKPEKGNQFICVTATIRNTSRKKATFLPLAGYKNKTLTATLYYKNKYEYQPSNLFSYSTGLINSSIKPLASKNGILVFEVPKKVAKDKKNLTLKISTNKKALVYSLK